MKKMLRNWAIKTPLIMVATALLVGCGAGNSIKQAKQKIDDALFEIEIGRPILEDIHFLNNRIDQLGERWDNLNDTLAEGNSLVKLLTQDLDALQEHLERARAQFSEVASIQGAGDYPEYAKKAQEAVSMQLQALETNRELVRTLAELLSLLDLAQNEEQLQYFVDELGRLSSQLQEEFSEAARLAEEADTFHMEKGL
jgi:chromosome segregation ATPase